MQNELDYHVKYNKNKFTGRLDANFYHPKYTKCPYSRNKLHTLKNIAQFVKRRPEKGQKYSYITLKSIKDNKIMTENAPVAYKELPSRGKNGSLVQMNDIIISKNTKNLFVVLVKNRIKNLLASNVLMVLRPKNISSRLLKILLGLEYVKKQIARYSVGTTFQTISKSDLANIKIPVPNDTDIPGIESKLDEIRTKKQKIKKDYSQRFVTMNEIFLTELGAPNLNTERDSVTNNIPWNKIKLYNLSPHNYTKNNMEIRKALQRYNSYSLKDVTHIRGGLPINKEQYKGEDYPLLKNKLIKRYKIDFDNLASISGEGLKKIIALNKNDIVVGTLGNNMGKAALIGKQIEHFLFDNHVCRVRINDDAHIKSKYLVICLNSYICQQQFKILSRTKNNYPQLYISHVKNIRIPIPSPSLQQNIIDNVYEFYNKITKKYSSLNKLEMDFCKHLENLLK